MNNFSKRLGVISKLADLNPRLGKTAMMKYIFLLQNVYKLPLNYEFDIYTYGPYSSEVMEDIDLARTFDVITMREVDYPSGLNGYAIELSTKGKETIVEVEDFLMQYQREIEEVITLFGEKKAKDLELISTIVYMYQAYLKNKIPIDIDAISNNVNKIKPHFDLMDIKKQYESLDNLGVLHG